MHTRLWSENLKGSDHLDDVDVVVEHQKWCRCVLGWINLASDTVLWRVIVNTAIVLRV
jgi:hypothetical protein